MTSLPLLRENHGFQRTICGCEFCKVHCQHIPGALDPADLTRLCPPGEDLFSWAARHLLALVDRPYPTLVPARQANGHCLWHFQGKCAVHADAPFGCAFFDSHMGDEEIAKRESATIQARRLAAESGGIYFRVWDHLRQNGLVGKRGDREAVRTDFQKLQRNSESKRRRMT